MSNQAAKIRRKRCKECGELFAPYLSTDRYCSPGCAISHLKSDEGQKKLALVKAKDQKNKIKKAKKELNKDSLIDKAQKVFNEWVRLDDIDKPCCSCGKQPHETKEWDAGHFRTVAAAPELRLHRWNVNKECKHCNWWDSNHLIGYRKTIEATHPERLEFLDFKGHPAKHYTVEYLERFIRVFRKRIRVRKEIRG